MADGDIATAGEAASLAGVEIGAPDITPANAYAQADKARLLRMDGPPARYGQRIHPDHPLVLDHASIHELARNLRLLHHQAADRAAHALNAMIDDFECMSLIHQLRDGWAASVMIINDNPDGDPTKIICNAEWTGYQDREIDGIGVLECLRAAYAEKELFGAIAS